MALDTTDIAKTYAGNGSTLSFSFPYYFLRTADLVVLLVTNSTETAVLQVEGTDYTVNGTLDADGNVIYTSGGSVAMTVAPPVGTTLVIYRNPAATQDFDPLLNGKLDVLSLETALDKCMMVIQRLAYLLGRSVTLPDSFTPTFNPALPLLLDQNPNCVVVVNGSGNGFAMGPNVAQIAGAQSAALSAEAAQTAAQSAQTAAAASEAAAADSEAAAASSAASAAASATSAAATGLDQGSTHSVTDGQAATDLAGETFDSASHTSALCFFEVRRGSGPIATSIGWFQLSYSGTSWAVFEGPYSGAYHGVTWSLTGTTVAQLQAALDSGAGNGTIKIKKSYF